MWRFLQNIFGLGRIAGAGAAGERAAADWLKVERRFQIISRNWRSPRDRRDEIDLVCRDGDALVFVEVKARAAGALVPGYYAVDDRKKRALQRAAEAYLARLRHKPETFRFDVVEVALPPEASSMKVEILHFENVPLFPKNFRG
ncbi:MAG: YraN family protein [Opitutaceae bacterium]